MVNFPLLILFLWAKMHRVSSASRARRIGVASRSFRSRIVVASPSSRHLVGVVISSLSLGRRPVGIVSPSFRRRIVVSSYRLVAVASSSHWSPSHWRRVVAASVSCRRHPGRAPLPSRWRRIAVFSLSHRRRFVIASSSHCVALPSRRRRACLTVALPSRNQ